MKALIDIFHVYLVDDSPDISAVWVHLWNETRKHYRFLVDSWVLVHDVYYFGKLLATN